MAKKLVRAGLAVVAAGLLVTTVGMGTAFADDSGGGGGGSIEGHGESFGSSDFHASNHSDNPFDADGFYTGHSPAGPVITLKGPVTCLDVRGDQAGFIYKVDDQSAPPFSGMEVKVSVEQGHDGGQNKIKFDFAQPAGSHKDCAPDLSGASDFHGDLTVDPDGGDD